MPNDVVGQLLARGGLTAADIAGFAGEGFGKSGKSGTIDEEVAGKGFSKSGKSGTIDEVVAALYEIASSMGDKGSDTP